MARFRHTAPYFGKGQKMLDARYQRVLSVGGILPAMPDGHAVVGYPGLRKAIFAEETRLGLSNISPLGQSRDGGSVGQQAARLSRFYAKN